MGHVQGIDGESGAVMVGHGISIDSRVARSSQQAR